MLTGEVPFDGETDFSVKDQQINSPPPDLLQSNPQISPRLAEMVLKAMAKNPDVRFQDCSEFLESLGSCSKMPITEPVDQKFWVAAEFSTE